MNNEPYDDAVLSAIIDNEADAETVASVEADPIASKRLAQMRQGVLLVAESVPDATPERRSASIAAALAAATSAPEVTSLAAARHNRDVSKKRTVPKVWMAGVAAAVAFVIAIPLALSLGGSDTADTATDAAEIAVNDDVSLSVPSAAAEVSDSDKAVEEALEADAEDGNFATAQSVADEMADDAANDPRAFAVIESDLPSANNIDKINELIALDTITPEYDAQAVIDVDVSERCVRPREGVTNERPYGLVKLTPFGGSDRLILVEFADDGTTRVLDAEDCSPLG
jgi:hypothetical protein